MDNSKLPEGWQIKCLFRATLEARRSNDGLELTIEQTNEGGTVEIYWSEPCDDGYGTTSRRKYVPVSVIRELLAEHDRLLAQASEEDT